MTKQTIVLLLLGSLTSLGVCAHHSRAAFFDMSQTVEIAGHITRVQWRHPHVRYWLQADEEYGGALWEMETTPPSILERYGISSDILSVGAHVRVAGPPSKFKENVMEVSQVLIPDGREVMLHNGLAPRWSQNVVERKLTTFSDEEVRASEATAHGIFRVWRRTVAPGSSGFWLDEYPLTPAGQEIANAWDPVVDVDTGCLPKGMPRVMYNGWPFEFVDEKVQIRLRIEEFDIERIIYLTDDRAEKTIAYSPLGYSTGHWENGELAVRTSHIQARYFGTAGIKLSPEAVIDERFILSTDENTLNYEMTVTDPATFTELITQTFSWSWIPGEKIKPYNCIETPDSWSSANLQ